MNLSPIDAIPVFFLFFIFFKSRRTDEAFAKLKAKEVALKNEKDNAASQNKWNEELEIAYQNYLIAISGGFFQFWIGPRSFAASICGSIASLALGFTSLPGFIAGLCFSSPRLHGFVAATLGILFR